MFKLLAFLVLLALCAVLLLPAAAAEPAGPTLWPPEPTTAIPAPTDTPGPDATATPFNLRDLFTPSTSWLPLIQAQSPAN